MLLCDFLVTMMPLDDKVSALLQYCGTFVIYVVCQKPNGCKHMGWIFSQSD